MILQALNRYYEWLKDDPQADIPQRGFGRHPISFALVIDGTGRLMQVRDIREKHHLKLTPVCLTVPQIGKKRSSDITPSFMWDNTGYVLGADARGTKERAQHFRIFKDLHHRLGDSLNDPGMIAVLSFLDSWNPDHAQHLEQWGEMAGSNLVFQIYGEQTYIHDHPEVRQAWVKHRDDEASEVIAACLVSGVKTPISRLHGAIKGVQGAQSAGASIVSFNLEAFQSYRKKQNFNAPVGESAAFAYTTALNHLLRFDSRQKVRIGDATMVFWTERASPIEEVMRFILDPCDTASDLSGVRLFLAAARDRQPLPAVGDPGLGFCILGLSPNASRLSARFWHASTIADVGEKIGQHFRDLAIIRSEMDPEFPGLRQLLKEIAVQRKTEKIPPLLAGALMRSILTGTVYPQSQLSALIGRIRADQTVNYPRAAMIKACLNRKHRISRIKEVTMSLDKESTHVAYLLGRLLSVLEKVQKDAIPGINRTIKDRFYGSASTTPSIVFPKLFRLAQHYLQRAGYGGRTDNMIEDIMQGIGRFPIHLSLDDQGMFAIGYYHQRQAFYVKSESQQEGG